MSTKCTLTFAHVQTSDYFMSLVLYAWSHIYLYFHLDFFSLDFQISRLDFVNYTHIYIYRYCWQECLVPWFASTFRFQLLPLKRNRYFVLIHRVSLLPDFYFSCLNFWNKYLGRCENHSLTNSQTAWLRLESREHIAFIYLWKFSSVSMPGVVLVLFQLPTTTVFQSKLTSKAWLARQVVKTIEKDLLCPK